MIPQPDIKQLNQPNFPTKHWPAKPTKPIKFSYQTLTSQTKQTNQICKPNIDQPNQPNFPTKHWPAKLTKPTKFANQSLTNQICKPTKFPNQRLTNQTNQIFQTLISQTIQTDQMPN